MNQTKHTAALRAQLTDLAGMRAAAQHADGQIVAAAAKRLDAVTADLEKLRPRVHLDEEAARRYEALTLERGRLERILTER